MIENQAAIKQEIKKIKNGIDALCEEFSVLDFDFNDNVYDSVGMIGRIVKIISNIISVEFLISPGIEYSYHSQHLTNLPYPLPTDDDFNDAGFDNKRLSGHFRCPYDNEDWCCWDENKNLKFGSGADADRRFIIKSRQNKSESEHSETLLSERWECNECGSPCRVEIIFSNDKLPEHLKHNNDRFRCCQCLCNERVPHWKKI